MSPKKWKRNTFGWARAEVVGALINAVFLYALCFSITVEAIKRFLVLEPIENPQLILLVGGIGLAINLVGMLLFGDVGHGHHDCEVLKVGAHAGDVQQVDVRGAAEDYLDLLQIVVSWTSALLNLSLDTP